MLSLQLIDYIDFSLKHLSFKLLTINDNIINFRLLKNTLNQDFKCHLGEYSFKFYKEYSIESNYCKIKELLTICLIHFSKQMTVDLIKLINDCIINESNCSIKITGFFEIKYNITYTHLIFTDLFIQIDLNVIDIYS
jgi:hypothetical protein